MVYNNLMGENNNSSEAQNIFREHVKWRSSITGVPKDILEKVQIVQLDQYSYEPTGVDSVQYWVDKYKKRGEVTIYDNYFFTHAFCRDVSYSRERSLPVSLPEQYHDNLPFAYDGGYIIIDDNNNLQVMTAANPNEKTDTFGDMHDHAKNRLENRTGKKLSEFKAAQRCYVVHTYNQITEMVETLIIPIVSYNRDDTKQFLGNSRLAAWPEVWGSTRLVNVENVSTDVTSSQINENLGHASSVMIAEAEDRYSKALARQWMFNQSGLSVKFITSDSLNEWSRAETFAEQTRGKLREELLIELADPTIERDEAYRNYMRKTMLYGSQKSRELVK